MTRSLVVLMVLGATTALMGGYWDDAWHTERGRDSPFIAPHVAIYGGIAAVGAGLALSVLLTVRRRGWSAVASDRQLALAVVAVVATLASGPVDAVWHEAFGRDAVLWSPPHLLGIVGTLALGAALLVKLTGRPALAALAGGLVLSAAMFPVAEYDTDVPQFATVWYLPAAAAGAAVAFVLIAQVAWGAWAVTQAAAVHLLLVLGTSGLLSALDFSPPGLPLVVGAAVAFDLCRRRGGGAAVTAPAVGAALTLTYVLGRNGLGDGVRFTAGDAAVGGLLAVAVLGAVLGLRPWPRPAGPAAVAVGLALVASGVAAPRASAHDPGQGEVVARVGLRVEATGGRVALRGRLPEGLCRRVTGGEVVARRGGVERRGPLRLAGCEASGTVETGGRGRWFVYADLDTPAGRVESWLPVDAGGTRAVVADPRRDAYLPAGAGGSSAIEAAAGLAVYLAMAGLLALTLVWARPSRAAGS